VAADGGELTGVQVGDQQAFPSAGIRGDDPAVRADHHGDSGKGQAGAVVAGLIARHDKNPVVKRPGRKMPQPGVTLFRRSPRGEACG